MVRRADDGGADTVVVLDFETTGLSPDAGDRAIEIGAVRLRAGVVVERFQELMNPGRRVSAFIEDYTGISNQMLRAAPPCAEVMARFADFIGEDTLVAHNASFDQRFLDSELGRIQRRCAGQFLCSMLLARRLYQGAPNHRLGGLVAYKRIPNDGVFHRALADAEMTSRLWLLMLDELRGVHGLAKPSVRLVRELSCTPKGQVAGFLSRQAAGRRA